MSNRTAYRAEGSTAGLRLLLGVCIVLSVAMIGCRQKPEKEPNEVGAQEPNTALLTPPEDDGIAARVNDANIMEEDVEAIVVPIIKTYEERPDQYSAAFIEQRRKELKEAAIKKLVIEHLLTEEVNKQGIVVTDQEVEDKIAEQAAAQEPNMTVEEYLQTVQADGTPLEAFRGQIKTQIGWDKVANNYLKGKVEVTEEEAREFYNKNAEQFKTPERVRASHILIRPIDSSDPNYKAQARERAEDLLKQLRNGADFAELAMDYSDDESSVNGGDLGYFTLDGKFERPFAKAAFALDVNEISDIVETSFGFHIIKVTDRQPERELTFAQVKDSLIQQLQENKKLNLLKQFFRELQQQADVVIRQ